MEIALTIEQEALLMRIAALEGKRADELAVEVLSRGLRAEGAALVASPSPDPSRGAEGSEAAARMLELRKENLLPEGVTIQDLMREGRA